jgi:phage terminase Nu1 subunit (DNA packaging protein)
MRVRSKRSDVSFLAEDGRSIRATLNAAQFAQLCKLSAGTVSSKIDSGTIVCTPSAKDRRRGAAVQIDVVRSLRNLLAERAAKPEAARVTVAHEQAETLRLKNAVTRGEYVKAAAVRQRNMGACAALVETFNALPQRCTSDPEIQQRIAEAILEARHAFADRLERLAEHDHDPDLIISAGDRQGVAAG